MERVWMTYYGLADIANPSIIRYVGITTDPESREEGHVSASHWKLNSPVDIWKSAVGRLGRQVIFSVLDYREFAKLAKWPNVESAAFSHERLVMDAAQANGGLLLNNEVLSLCRHDSQIPFADHMKYLDACRNTLCGIAGALACARKFENEQPHAFNIFQGISHELEQQIGSFATSRKEKRRSRGSLQKATRVTHTRAT